MDETIYAAGQWLPRHVHPRPVLIAFLEGSWIHSVGEETTRVGPGDLVFLPAFMAHELTFVGRIGRAFSIEFDDAQLADRLPRQSMHTSDPQLLALTLAAYRTFARDQLLRSEAFSNALEGGLVAIDRRHRIFSDNGTDSWLAAALDRVRNSIGDEVRMSGIARAVGINAAHMSRRFRQVFGESMSEFRERLRLEQASRALLGQAGTISSIAADLGYCDHAHLTRMFRRATCMTPSEFRRIVRDTCLANDVLCKLHSRQAFAFRRSSAAGIRLI
jgi:AraC-like DNA-binding protein